MSVIEGCVTGMTSIQPFARSRSLSITSLFGRITSL
ncbi:hypothetical protein EMIT0111MI5_110060 [Burkholderia sp. IT-111MI5]